MCWYIFALVSTIPCVQICNVLTFANNISALHSALKLGCNSSIFFFSQLYTAVFKNYIYINILNQIFSFRKNIQILSVLWNENANATSHKSSPATFSTFGNLLL